MNIVYLTAGAAGMYCGSCLHDNTLASALIEAGEQVLLVPAYTPIRTDEEDVSSRHLVFGGINVWLQQRSRLFQFTPAWVDRLLDSPRLVGWLSRAAGVTRPESLGPMTLSMLQGLDGRQQKEFRKLVSWLAEEIRPDIVHLSNTLLVGVVQPLKQVLGVPIVCSLSGEDAFLERLPSVWKKQALERLRLSCRRLDRLIALNDDYAHFMSQYLDYPRERILTVPHGLNLRGYGPRERPVGSGESFTIGYLARICAEKGLHVLAEAFAILSQRPGLPPLQLAAAGYLGRLERSYLDEVRSFLARQGLAESFHYVGELGRAEKIAFLQALDVFSLPTIYPERKGLPALESLAAGTPVVLPDHGGFSELVSSTGGGLLCRAHDAVALAEQLGRLAADPALARSLGETGRAAVAQRFQAAHMASATRAIYHELVGSGPAWADKKTAKQLHSPM